jgi:hypothetical protein
VESDILLFAAIGFFAQMIDGALGMAFGVICSSSLVLVGIVVGSLSVMNIVNLFR